VRKAALLATLVVVLAGCGGSDEPSGPVEVDPSTALGLSNGQEAVVRGYFARAPRTILPRLCTQLAESYPPTCAMPSLPVSNLSEAEEKKLPLTRDPETGATWSQDEVQLHGRIEDGGLVVE
jgi:hypothetical protein